ncbi:MAG: SRPBCC family protein [Sciscionella sp.]
MASDSRHISIDIERGADAVYEYAANPANLPSWAAALAHSALEKTDEGWVTDSPMGRVVVNFVEHNDFGVLDHVVTLPSAERCYNPLRVIPNGEHCEVVFTVRRRSGMNAEDLAGDAAAVAADLDTLKRILESR